MESDDEFGRDPYQYRNGNASENEEYDQNNYDENDDDEATRYPWLKPSFTKNDDEMEDDEDDRVEVPKYYAQGGEAEVVGYVSDSSDEDADDGDVEKEKEEMKKHDEEMKDEMKKSDEEMKEDMKDDEEMKDTNEIKDMNADGRAKGPAAAKKGGLVATPVQQPKH